MKTHNISTFTALLAAGFLFSFIFPRSLLADSIILPESYANKAGESRPSILERGSRSVIIYGSDLFQSVAPEGMLIEGIQFRIDEDMGRAVDFTQNLEVHAGLSKVHPADVLFPGNFSGIVGPSDQVVIPRTSIQIASSYTPGEVNEFEINIPFQHAFEYQPRNGSLYLDFRNYEGGFVLVDGTGTVRSINYVKSGIDQDSYFGPGGGVIAKILFTPIPEPGISGLILFYLGILYCWRKLAFK
jgi:hypothetical protein